VPVLVRGAPVLVLVRGALAAVLVRAAPVLVLVREAADLVAPVADLVQVVEARTIGQAACLPAAMPAWVARCRAPMAGAAALARRKPPVAPVGVQELGEMPGLIAVASGHVVALPLPGRADSAVVAVSPCGAHGPVAAALADPLVSVVPVALVSSVSAGEALPGPILAFAARAVVSAHTGDLVAISAGVSASAAGLAHMATAAGRVAALTTDGRNTGSLGLAIAGPGKAANCARI
jgi:hypothetical protein